MEPWNDPKIKDNLSPFNIAWPLSTRMIGGRLMIMFEDHGLSEARRKRVALVGFEEKNARTAPYEDPEWEIWGFNMGNRMGIHRDGRGRFRADRWFDLHEQHAQDEKDMDWIGTCPCPIYLTSVYGGNTLAFKYPIELVESWLETKFGISVPYWCSSFAYAFALAMMEGAEEIGLFGINLDWGRERVYERGNLEFYIGIALAMGVKVRLSPGSKLLGHPARYGFEYAAEKEAVEQDIGELVRQILGNDRMSAQVDKAIRYRHYAMSLAAHQLQIQIQRLQHMKPDELNRLMEEDGERVLRLLKLSDGLEAE